jgi:hypothetical protein
MRGIFYPVSKNVKNNTFSIVAKDHRDILTNITTYWKNTIRNMFPLAKNCISDTFLFSKRSFTVKLNLYGTIQVESVSKQFVSVVNLLYRKRVSIELKQTEDQPKPFEREHIWVFFR